MELKATELRIGNFVGAKGMNIFFTIEGVKENQIFSSGYWRLLESFEPIPLTEEWLLKFNILKDYDGLFIINDKIKLSLGFDNAKIYLNGIYQICEIDGFVHTLQNIIFALTNEELEIK